MAVLLYFNEDEVRIAIRFFQCDILSVIFEQIKDFLEDEIDIPKRRRFINDPSLNKF